MEDPMQTHTFIKLLKIKTFDNINGMRMFTVKLITIDSSELLLKEFYLVTEPYFTDYMEHIIKYIVDCNYASYHHCEYHEIARKWNIYFNNINPKLLLENL
jgi:hypothetical protein